MQPKVEFLTGSAGTGKTTILKSRLADRDPITRRHYGTLTATTGIAAVNLSGSSNDSVTTINSALKYFDVESLKSAYAEGKLQRQFFRLLDLGGHLCVDEVSMMDADTLDILYLALEEFNNLSSVENRGGLGLVLSGDFCQLAPVKGKYAFTAQCWDKFAANTTRLTKVWRQDNLEFLGAINSARQGDGSKCAEILAGLENYQYQGTYGSSESQIQTDLELFPTKIFYKELDLDFDGTTILPVNNDVDRVNNVRLVKLLQNGGRIEFKNYRWGQQRQEWKLIPDITVLAKDAYVMILSNNPPEFDYANGDCGHIREAVTEGQVHACIQLRRNGNVVTVKPVNRKITQKETPDGLSDPDWPGKRAWLDVVREDYDKRGLTYTREEMKAAFKASLMELTLSKRQQGKPYFDFADEKWVMGEITYMPLRLAYASTCHKTQGLTLDNIQIDPHHRFFREGSMFYVALSRVRSHKGLRIIGGPKLVEERANINREVLPWI